MYLCVSMHIYTYICVSLCVCVPKYVSTTCLVCINLEVRKETLVTWEER